MGLRGLLVGFPCPMLMRKETYIVVFCLLLGACSKTQVVQQIPTYDSTQCYRTLAVVDCHEQPLTEEANREVAWHVEPTGKQDIETDFKCLDLALFEKPITRIGCTAP